MSDRKKVETAKDLAPRDGDGGQEEKDKKSESGIVKSKSVADVMAERNAEFNAGIEAVSGSFKKLVDAGMSAGMASEVARELWQATKK